MYLDSKEKLYRDGPKHIVPYSLSRISDVDPAYPVRSIQYLRGTFVLVEHPSVHLK